MSKYYCYQIWELSEPDCDEMSFEKDQQAIDYWLGLYKEHRLKACFSIVRLVEINEVFYEDFIAMFRDTKHGLDVILSHAL